MPRLTSSMPAFDLLTFENEKMKVLETLIDNPTFCGHAKARLLERLDDLSFSSNRKRLLNTMGRQRPVLMFPDQVGSKSLSM